MNSYYAPAANSRARYRTIKQCRQELLKLDKDCKISEYFIRRLCRQNKIEYRANGTKSLVNYDSLLAYLGISDFSIREEQGNNLQKATKRHCQEFGLISCEMLESY